MDYSDMQFAFSGVFNPPVRERTDDGYAWVWEAAGDPVSLTHFTASVDTLINIAGYRPNTLIMAPKVYDAIMLHLRENAERTIRFAGKRVTFTNRRGRTRVRIN